MKKFLIAGAAVLGLAAGAAYAQPINSDSSEQITVVPPFSTQQSTTPLKGGMNFQTISVNRYVTYGDLDLSKPSDRSELENRIHDTAREACNALDAKFPPTVYVPVGESQDCIGSASRGALAMANISDDEGGVPE
jgi:UrcA family protein